ncbi:MAG: hypothetical protein Q4E75_03805 [bacterium]|nr:hypothetical protein [bacterium]
MVNVLYYEILITLVTVVIVICSVAIFLSVRFQKKNNKKYNDLVKLLSEKENVTFELKNGMTKEEINQINPNIDVDSLITNLCNIYMDFESHVSDMNTDFDNILTGMLKEFYINKLESFKLKNYKEVKNEIDLIKYFIEEYSNDTIKFKVNINCFNYKLENNIIVSGSNLNKKEQVIELIYKNVSGKWLISAYDIVYEKELCD